ncbi:MAG: autotransporter family protein [Trinickia sp.]|uniref:autotransporter family protein n=1 Tax=Trinickia sp. TaxID=2571163 RepID=UPI003F7E1077
MKHECKSLLVARQPLFFVQKDFHSSRRWHRIAAPFWRLIPIAAWCLSESALASNQQITFPTPVCAASPCYFAGNPGDGWFNVAGQPLSLIANSATGGIGFLARNGGIISLPGGGQIIGKIGVSTGIGGILSGTDLTLVEGQQGVAAVSAQGGNLTLSGTTTMEFTGTGSISEWILGSKGGTIAFNGPVDIADISAALGGVYIGTGDASNGPSHIAFNGGGTIEGTAPDSPTLGIFNLAQGSTATLNAMYVNVAKNTSGPSSRAAVFVVSGAGSDGTGQFTLTDTTVNFQTIGGGAAYGFLLQSDSGAAPTTVSMDNSSVTMGSSGSVIRVEGANATINVKGGSVLTPFDSAASGSLIAVGRSPSTSTNPGAGSLTFNATDSILTGNALAEAPTANGAKALTMNLDGSTSWRGDLAVEGGASAQAGLAGTAHWAGTTVGNSGIDVALHDASTWTVTANPSGLEALSFDGGTVQAGVNDLAFSSPITLAGGGGTFDTNGFDASVSSVIAGAGGFTKTGAGTLDLTAANTYAGATTIAGSTLAVDGSIASPVTVAAAGTLGGSGTIFGKVDNFGVVAPGNSSTPGQALTITGDYKGESGSALALKGIFTDSSGASHVDRLVIDGGNVSGHTSVFVTTVGGNGEETRTLDQAIPVVVAQGGTTGTQSFALGAPAAAGPYEYLLYRGSAWGVSDPDKANSWYLSSIDPQGTPTPTPTYRPEVPIFTAMPGVARRLNMAMLGTFDERVGNEGLLFGDTGRPSAWGRLIRQNTNVALGGPLSPDYDGFTTGLQTGMDFFRLEHANGSQDRIGAFFAYGQSLGEVSGFALGEQGYDAGKMNLSAYSLGVNWTHRHRSGWYTDAVLMGTKYDGTPSSNRGIGANISGYGITLSLEGGYPLPLGETLTLEPQAQLVWQHIGLSGSQDRFSSISYETPDAFWARIGVKLAGSFSVGRTVFKPYVTTNLWQEFLGTDKTIFAQTPLSSGGSNATTAEVTAGLVTPLTQRVGLWANVSYLTSIAGLLRRSWRVTGGVRVVW